MEMKRVVEIKTHELFENLFPIQDHVLSQIEKDMRDGNYDFSQPIILATWEGQKAGVCIDGHTRLKAAEKVGIEEVPIFFHEFDTEEEALEKAIKLQRNRRNMTDADIISCIEILDKARPRGGDRRSVEAKSKASNDAIEKPAKSAEETANLLGISTTKVEKNRSVLKNGDPETIEAVKNGDMSMNKACQETREKRRKAKSDDAKSSRQHTNTADMHLGQVDQVAESASFKNVPLPISQYTALSELKGSVEEHVAKAIDLYLESQRKIYRGFSEEMDLASSEFSASVINDEDAGDAPEDDDDEYFYPDRYEEEELRN